jgi:DNA-binding NarL/FixJ family response regulator
MMKIMVVEDHALVRNLLCQLLAAEPDVELARGAPDGEEALRLLQEEQHPDIVLTDLNLPGMDGLELTRRALTLDQDLRVVILTLQRDFGLRQRSLTAGAKDCVLKDGSFADLLAAIRAVHTA